MPDDKPASGTPARSRAKPPDDGERVFDLTADGFRYVLTKLPPGSGPPWMTLVVNGVHVMLDPTQRGKIGLFIGGLNVTVEFEPGGDDPPAEKPAP